jgi:predicted nucleic acid-binding protein
VPGPSARTHCGSDAARAHAALSTPRGGRRASHLALRDAGEWIEDPPLLALSRDPRDDIFIAVAATAGADFLVTRDDDLKRDPAVQEYLAGHGCAVVTVAEFVARLRPQPG